MTRKPKQSGQTAIMFTLAALPIFGMLGLVVDTGWAYFRKEVAQTAADSAAMAAGLAAYTYANAAAVTCATPNVRCYAADTPCANPLVSPPTDNIQAGCLYARDNGFVTTPGGKQKVAFQSGVGTSPTNTGVTIGYWVIAHVSEQIPQLFSAVLGHPTLTITARATTGTREATSGGCIITLDPTNPNSIRMTGTAQVSSGCGVFVNSNDPAAINLSGGGSITTIGTAKTEIVGNCNGCSNIHPAPLVGRPYQGDPLADMTPPDDIGCTTTAQISLGSHDTQTINPGEYCGGISLGAQSTLTLNPGLYIIKNGISLGAQTTLQMNGTAGVTIYMPTGGITMTGGATVNLSAPSSGTWQGILFYQDRLNTSSSTVVGQTAGNMHGALYFPAADLTYDGGASSNATASSTTLISKTLTLVGTTSISSAATTRFTGVTGGVFLIE